MKKRTYESCPNCECKIGSDLSREWNGEDNTFTFTCPYCKKTMKVIVSNITEFYCEVETK